jgi:hypothetical protein
VIVEQLASSPACRRPGHRDLHEVGADEPHSRGGRQRRVGLDEPCGRRDEPAYHERQIGDGEGCAGRAVFGVELPSTEPDEAAEGRCLPGVGEAVDVLDRQQDDGVDDVADRLRSGSRPNPLADEWRRFRDDLWLDKLGHRQGEEHGPHALGETLNALLATRVAFACDRLEDHILGDVDRQHPFHLLAGQHADTSNPNDGAAPRIGHQELHVVNTVPSNHTHADAALVERARIVRFLLKLSEAAPSTEAALALETGAEAIDEGAHHDMAAVVTQPTPRRGWGDCWSELMEHVGAGHPLHEAMAARRALGLVRYGQPLQRDDGRDPEVDLQEELLDCSVYAWRLGLRALAVEMLTLAQDPSFHDDVFASLASDEVWAESQPVSQTSSVLAEVRIERAAQDLKWGEQNHPFFGDEQWHLLVVDLEAAARQELERSPTYAAILLEEVCEAMREPNADRLREELIQVAAVAVAAVEALDRRAGGAQ